MDMEAAANVGFPWAEQLNSSVAHFAATVHDQRLPGHEW